jgi:hypothetical protein
MGHVYGTLTCDSQKFKEPAMTQNDGSQKKRKKAQRTGQRTYPEKCLKKLAGSLKSFKNPRPTDFSPPKKIPSKTWNQRRLYKG